MGFESIRYSLDGYGSRFWKDRGTQQQQRTGRTMLNDWIISSRPMQLLQMSRSNQCFFTLLDLLRTSCWGVSYPEKSQETSLSRIWWKKLSDHSNPTLSEIVQRLKFHGRVVSTSRILQFHSYAGGHAAWPTSLGHWEWFNAIVFTPGVEINVQVSTRACSRIGACCAERADAKEPQPGSGVSYRSQNHDVHKALEHSFVIHVENLGTLHQSVVLRTPYAIYVERTFESPVQKQAQTGKCT